MSEPWGKTQTNCLTLANVAYE